jgi:hypothetical protein
LQEFRIGRRPLSVLWAILEAKNLGRAKLRLSRRWQSAVRRIGVEQETVKLAFVSAKERGMVLKDGISL